MAKTLSRTKLPWGPRGYYEGKPSFRKTTALSKNSTRTNEGPELSGRSAQGGRKKTGRGSQHAPAEPGEPRPGADLNCRWQYTRSGPREIGRYANTLLCRDECRIQS